MYLGRLDHSFPFIRTLLSTTQYLKLSLILKYKIAENTDSTRNSSAVTSFTSDSDNDDSPASAAVRKPLNFKQRKSKWVKNKRCGASS